MNQLLVGISCGYDINKSVTMVSNSGCCKNHFLKTVYDDKIMIILD